MPRRRYRHFMHKLDRVGNPYLVLCVGVESQVYEDDGNRHVRRERLLSWEVVSLRPRKADCRVTGVVTGKTASGFWEYIGGLSCQGRPITMISSQCTRVWSLLQLWEEIESGKIREGWPNGRTGKDPVGGMRALPEGVPENRQRTGSADLQRMHARMGAVFILEDPPSIIRIECGQKGLRLCWWDTKNWGIDLTPQDVAEGSGAVCVSKWFCSLRDMASRDKLPNPSVTAATWALQSYRLRYYPGGMYMHTNDAVAELESAAYYGGRTECYRLGKAPSMGTMIDVRGAYLACCAEQAVPVRLAYHITDRLSPLDLDVRAGVGIIARCLIETEAPIVPYRRQHDIIYPVGRFWTTLAGPEITLALNMGALVVIDGYAEYALSPSLRKFAESMDMLRYAADQAGEKSVSAAIKSAGVGLVGKFAQRNRSWIRCSEMDGTMQYGETWGSDANGEATRYRFVSGLCYQEIDLGWAPEANLAVAAWVTSAARVKLWHMMECAGRLRVWYCDTDCVITDDIGADNLRRSRWYGADAMGQWSVRHGPGRTEIYGLKHYRIGDHYCCAGLPKGTMSSCGDGEHYWWIPPARDQVDKGKRPDTQATPLRWPNDDSYSHGEVLADGTVVPIRLNER